ncbi:MAG: FadR family transcriptional regulator [Chloroflexi bacterium]|nr:FadR family transcriptional regulator [Chloroflexota bacterium]
MEAKSLRSPALNRAVQERIKENITTNRMKPGDPLPPEARLAADLEVSRSSVREAVKALESLGIIEVRQGAGIFVREFNFDSVLTLLAFGLNFDPTKLSEILQIRKLIETAAIVEVCRRITPAGLNKLQLLLEQWKGKVAANEPTSEEDRAFHRTLYEVLGNKALIALIDVFWVAYQHYGILPSPHPETTLQNHFNVLEAVRNQDGALAAQRIQAHFAGLEQLVQGIVDQGRQG